MKKIREFISKRKKQLAIRQQTMAKNELNKRLLESSNSLGTTSMLYKQARRLTRI